MAPSALLPGLRHAAGIVATLRRKVDKHAPLSSHATLIYTIALGEIEEAIRSLETPDLTGRRGHRGGHQSREEKG